LICIEFQDFDDGTALNCIELGQALDDIANALVDYKANIVAPNC